MSTKELSPELVIDFWHYMQKKYDTKVVNKKKSKLMRAVANFMDDFGIMSGKKFMNDFTTTLFGKIYVPFTIGDANTKRLESQIAICVHEHQHIQQNRRDNGYSRKYIFNKAYRAYVEAEAYGANMELHFWYAGHVLDPVALAEKLYDYGCKDKHIRVAQKHLESMAITVKYGGVINDSSKTAIAWLNEYAAEYRGTGQAVALPTPRLQPLLLKR